jgi:hypothetical protein
MPQASFSEVAALDLKTGRRTFDMAEATRQWRRHVFNPYASSSVDALTATVEAAFDFVSEFGPESLSLREIQGKLVQPEHLAALLRATSTWRDQIPGWADALNAAAVAVKSAGMDSEDVLFGMI